MNWHKQILSVALSVTLAGPMLASPALALAAPAAAVPNAQESAKKGLAWLASHQLANGGWGQGDEAVSMGGAGGLASVSNVADTGMAALALLRSGSTPAEGPYAANVKKAAIYVLSEVEASDADSLKVTQVTGTRVQGKIGPYIDTFVALTFLSEVKGRTGDPALDARVTKGVEKIVRKIEKNQGPDGAMAGGGWAPVLSQGMAAKGLNRAAQAGAKVPDGALAKAEGWAKSQFDAATGRFGGGAGDAGVGLYGAAATVGAIQDATTTNESREAYYARKAKEAAGGEERDQARRELSRIAETKRANEAAQVALVGRLSDPGFVAGFGSNGGEEFLSYMMVSEALLVKGGKEWQAWNDGMQANLGRVQNADGSWTGHHCITGRTFCTAAALLVLLAENAPKSTGASVVGQG